jgi:ADP-heptose:LPS heptosyltransferase
MLANNLLNGMLTVVNHLIPAEEEEARIQNPAFAPPQKTLVIPSRFIGDVILMTPFLNNLRRCLPAAAQMDLLATPATACLFRHLDGIGQVFIESRHFPKKEFELSHADFLKYHGYDTLFFCRYAPYWERAALRANIPQRVGFDMERLGVHGWKDRGHTLTHVTPSTPFNDTRSQVEVYLELLRSVGWPVTPDRLYFTLPEKLQQRSYQRLLSVEAGQHTRANGPRIALHMTAGSPGKEWDSRQWELLAKTLTHTYAPKLIAMGAARDSTRYEALTQSSGVPLLNLCGQFSVLESMALMPHLDMVITLDTAMAHIAAVGQVPRLIVLYGPTNPAQWKPQVADGTFLQQIRLGVPCQPCMARTCFGKTCLADLSAQQVFNAVQQGFRSSALETGTC